MSEKKKTETQGLRNPDLLTIKEAAEILGKDYQTVQRYCLEDIIPSEKYGRYVLINKKDLTNFTPQVYNIEHMTAEVGEKVLSIKKFSDAVGINRYILYRWIEKDLIPAIKHKSKGKKRYYYIKQSELIYWLECPVKKPFEVYCFKHNLMSLKDIAEQLNEPEWSVRVLLEDMGYKIHTFAGTQLIDKIHGENFILDNIGKVL